MKNFASRKRILQIDTSLSPQNSCKDPIPAQLSTQKGTPNNTESLLSTTTEESDCSKVREENERLAAQCRLFAKENRRLKCEVEMCLNENIDLEEECKRAHKELAKVCALLESQDAKDQAERLKVENRELRAALSFNTDVGQLKARLKLKDETIQQLQNQVQELTRDLERRALINGGSQDSSIAEEHERSGTIDVRGNRVRASRDMDWEKEDTQVEETPYKSMYTYKAFKVCRTVQQLGKAFKGV